MEPAIVLMSKVPRAGYTKTRLMNYLSGVECAEFHSACLADLSQLVEQTELTTYLYYTGGSLDEFSSDGAMGRLQKYPQTGQDLGERLYNVAVEVLAKHDRVIFIGSDMPQLSPSIFVEALEKLSFYDTVIGPAMDGGYYLLGIKQVIPELFSHIEWGTPYVLKTTLERIKILGLSVNLLGVKRDIDHWDDLVAFYQQGLTNQQYRTLKSYQYIKTSLEDIMSIYVK